MKEVYAAFIKFQSELKPVKEEAWNPHFKSTFADLSSILKAVTPLLAKNNLGVLQTCRVQESGTVLQTRIVHVSGEEIVSEMVLPFLPDPQKFGSLLTYYKRYQLQATLGVATKDEDDDGSHASEGASGPSRSDIDYLLAGIVKAKMTDGPVLKAVSAASKREVRTLAELTMREYEYAIKIVKAALEKVNA